MQALIDQLQGKIRSYKKQIEEAEEIAALNLAKFRQTQAQLTASSDAAEASEQALAKTRGRGSSLAPVCDYNPSITFSILWHFTSDTIVFQFRYLNLNGSRNMHGINIYFLFVSCKKPTTLKSWPELIDDDPGTENRVDCRAI